MALGLSLARIQIGDRKIEPGAATAEFELAAGTWKETLVRLEDESGKPVAGVVVNCSLGAVPWSRPRTDARGTCRIAMAPDLWLGLSGSPKAPGLSRCSWP